MKREGVSEIPDRIVIPLITYLLAGLCILNLQGLSEYTTAFVVWGILAGMFHAIQKFFSNRAVTMGLSLYAAGMALWFAIGVSEGGSVHAVMLMLGLAAVSLLRFVMKWRCIKIFAGFFGLGTLICYVITGEEFSRGLVFLAIILFLNAVSEIITWDYSDNVKSLLVIYVLIAVLTLLPPVSKEPYGWNFVFRMLHSLENIANRIAVEIDYRMMNPGEDGIFHFQTTGYSDDAANPAARLLERDVEQLVLRGDYTRKSLYLKGNVSGSYKQNGWHSEENFTVPDYRIDTLMTLYVIFRGTDDIGELRKFMDIKKQEITLENIKTESLFYPLKILDISADNMVQEGDNLRSERINGRGYAYSYCFVDLDYSNEYLSDLIRNSGGIIYEEQDYYHIYEVLEKQYGVKVPVIAFEDFVEMAAQYEKNVQEEYLGKDESVSDRTVLLSGEIAAGCQTAYDSCRALEEYLYRYHYNRVVTIPENVNMLDYFLFEGKEGYCVHYATALAVMLHCRDIPARVAEGFLVDYKTCTDNYTYPISAKKAHAWVEVYLQGFGWMRLEPTVVNAANANAVWYAEAEETEEVSEERAESIQSPEDPEETEPQDSTEEQKSSWLMMFKILGGMLVCVGTILAIVYARHRNFVKKSRNPDVVCNHLISVLGRRYSLRMGSETIWEYFGRLCELDNIPDSIREELPFVKNSMEEYWYGNGTIPQEVITRIKQLSR